MLFVRRIVLFIFGCLLVLCPAESTTVSTTISTQVFVEREIDGISEPVALDSKKHDAMKVANQTKDILDFIPTKINITDLREVTGVSQATDNVDIAPTVVKQTEVNVGVTTDNQKVNITEVREVTGVRQATDNVDIAPTVVKQTEVNVGVTTDDQTVNITDVREVTGVSQATDNVDIVPTVVKQTQVNVGVTTDDQTVNITEPPPLKAIEEEEQTISDIPSVDLSLSFNSISTKYCREKSLCNSNITLKTCYCDRICGVLKDCCEDKDFLNDTTLTTNQFSCSPIPGVSDNGQGVMVVTKCPPVWKDDITRALCERTSIFSDIISNLPVSDITQPQIVYKNEHCAQCNNIYTYKYWKAHVQCLKTASNNTNNSFDTNTCDFYYLKPDESSSFRKCSVYLNIISECAASYKDDEIRDKCTTGYYSVVYTKAGDNYRNKYCAVCNGVAVKNLYCESQMFLFREQSIIPPKLYNFRMIVDFNSKWVVRNQQITRFNDCRDNEVYDPFTETCREIFCPVSTWPLQGKCVPSQPKNDTSTPLTPVVKTEFNNVTSLTPVENCTLTKIYRDEIEFLNDSNIIIFRNVTFEENEYLKNGSNFLICLEKLNITSEMTGHNLRIISLYNFSDVESYVSLACLIVSIIALLVTLCVYILFSQLRNVPGKNLICLIVSLVVSQTLFIFAVTVANIQMVCTAFSIIMHYSFLCVFCWMNIIAFDLWLRFSHKFMSQRNRPSRSRRFYFYSLYGWCVPLLIVSVAVIFNYTSLNDLGAESFRPNYGQDICWITTRNALIVFLIVPLAIFKTMDFVFFGIIAYHIFRARREGALVRKDKNQSSFLIYLRLSLVMGLTWIFAFVANFTNNSVVWYLFIISNTLQGLFIALSFLCTKRIATLFRERYKTNSSATAATHMTVLSQTKSVEN